MTRGASRIIVHLLPWILALRVAVFLYCAGSRRLHRSRLCIDLPMALKSEWMACDGISIASWMALMKVSGDARPLRKRVYGRSLWMVGPWIMSVFRIRIPRFNIHSAIETRDAK